MKINEKNLCAFASSATPVDRDGWLDIRGEVGKTYQKRWFVLKGNLLFYFDKKGDKEPVGVIILEGCTIGEIFFSIISEECFDLWPGFIRIWCLIDTSSDSLVV